MPRNHDELTGTKATGSITDLDHFRDGFVTEREWALERGDAGDERPIKVAGRRRDRTNDRIAIVKKRRCRNFDVT